MHKLKYAEQILSILPFVTTNVVKTLHRYKIESKEQFHPGKRLLPLKIISLPGTKAGWLSIIPRLRIESQK